MGQKEKKLLTNIFLFDILTPTGRKTETLSPVSALTDKDSLLSNPREVSVVLSAGGTCNSICRSTHHAWLPLKLLPRFSREILQGIISGQELRATRSLAPTLHLLSSPVPQLLEFKSLFSAVTSFPWNTLLIDKNRKDITDSKEVWKRKADLSVTPMCLPRRCNLAGSVIGRITSLNRQWNDWAAKVGAEIWMLINTNWAKRKSVLGIGTAKHGC